MVHYGTCNHEQGAGNQTHHFLGPQPVSHGDPHCCCREAAVWKGVWIVRQMRVRTMRGEPLNETIIVEIERASLSP